MDNVTPRLVKCFQIIFPDLTETEVTRASQKSLAEWDSVAAITLLNVIEDEFQIEMDLDIVAELDSFAAVREHLAHRAEVA
jgi:acyl carrier protein